MSQKFVNCILRIKTKQNTNIVGRVKKVETEGVVLDDGLMNGEVLPEGWVVKSKDIADLQVIGKWEKENSETKPLQQLQKPKPLKIKEQKNKETFHNSFDLEEEFDFESNNLKFQKLPVTVLPPKPLSTNFTPHDTTTKKDRRVSSVKIQNATKNFLTDTNVSVPAIDLVTRSKILNYASEIGVGHERTIETMARAVVQTSIHSLGDACRLSPERERDRPRVCCLAGPHWQGAVAIATGRIFATLGVQTYVHSPKEELGVCRVEEGLYLLGLGRGCGFGRDVADLPNHPFDLIINGLNDHVGKVRNMAGNNVVFIDPPVTMELKNCKIVCPLMPLSYDLTNDVKCFVVNLGVPGGCFEREGVGYKSFFGDKLVVRIFGG